MSMREAAWASGTGRHVRYEAWDADSMQGCVCAPGWGGHACAVPQCPLAVDPHGTGAEEQTLRTRAVHVDEVQRFTLSVATPGAAVREVQRFWLAYAASASSLPLGDFWLTFDARYAVDVRGPGEGYTAECALCSHDAAARASFTSPALSIERFGSAAHRATATAAVIEAALEAFPAIDDVVVTGVPETVAYYGYEFRVTFTGSGVRGTLPAIGIHDGTTLGAIPITAAQRVVTGSHLTGPVRLAYNNAASVQRTDLAFVGAASSDHADCLAAYPAGFSESTGSCLGVNSAPAKVKAVLEAMPNVGTVAVSFEYGAEAGVEWLVTFTGGTYCQGDLALFTAPTFSADVNAVQDGAGGALGSAAFTAAAVVNGRFLAPTSAFSATWSWGGDVVTLDFTAAESAASMEAAIEAWPVGGSDTWRIGDVRVSRSVPADAPAGGDDYMGELQWTVTFLDVAGNVPAVALAPAASSPLDAAPGDAGDGGAVVDLVAQSRHEETAILRSSVRGVKETQYMALGAGGVDVDEVMTVTIASTDTTWVKGYLRLGFDSSGVKCPLCTVKAVHLQSGEGGDFFHLPGWGGHEGVDFDGNNAAHVASLEVAAAASLVGALETFPNIGPHNVAVSAAYTSGGGTWTVTLAVTFSGPDVGGDIADTALSVATMDGLRLGSARRVWGTRNGAPHEYQVDNAAISVAVASTQDGALLSGALMLGYDPWDAATNFPVLSGAAGATSGVLDLDALQLVDGLTEANLGAALAGALPGVEAGSITVSRLAFDGTPGMSFYFTFDTLDVGGGSVVGAANTGPRDAVSCSLPATAVYQGRLEGTGGGLVATATCTPLSAADTSCQHCAKGSHLTGSWRLVAGYKGVLRRSAELQWDANAATVLAALTPLFPGVPELEGMSVTRAPRTVHAPAHHGGYEWNVTAPASRSGEWNLTAEVVTLSGTPLGGTPGALGATFALTEFLPGAAPAQVDEVQLLECSCGAAGCSGAFKLTLNGEQTAAIPASASAADVRAALVAAFTPTPRPAPQRDVIVTFAPAAAGSVCVSGVAVTTAVRFVNWLGDLPPMAVDAADSSAMTLSASSGAVSFRVKGVGGAVGVAGFKARDGTKVGAPCAGRGLCSVDAGGAPVCVCDTNGGVAYTGDDCGTRVLEPTACAVDAAGTPCSGHGACTGAPAWRCECWAGYTGRGCEALACAAAPAWFDAAWGRDAAHARTPCAGLGECVAGVCACSSGFANGEACSRLRCPAGETNCGGRGECLDMAALAARSPGGAVQYLGAWDAHMVTGCDCVGGGSATADGVEGWRCSYHHCPAGADPQSATHGSWGTAGHEVQALDCSGSTGFVRLTYGNASTVWLDADAPPHPGATRAGAATLSVAEALDALPSLAGVVVSGDAGRLCSMGGERTMVTFRGNHGTVQLLGVEANGTLTATATQVAASTLVPHECNRRGVCDRGTGRCVCEGGFGSSNGNFTAGGLGDCGHRDADYTSKYVDVLWGGAGGRVVESATVGGRRIVDTSDFANAVQNGVGDSLEALRALFAG